MSELEWYRAQVWTIVSLLSRHPVGVPGRISLQAELEEMLDDIARLEAREARWLEMGGV